MKVTGILWLPLSFLNFIERRYDTMTTQKQSALQTIEEKKSLIAGIADKVWEFAELSLQEFKSAETYCEALEKEGIPMAQAEVTMIPQNYVKVTDETALKGLQRTLDLLDEDDDVQAVYHNWDEE